jgi:predicted phage-related endonuclease
MSTQSVGFTSPALPPSAEREQWLEGRREYIGGSDCSALFNEGYGCTRRLVYDKRGIKPDFPRTKDQLEILQRGTELEELVVFKFQKETGLKVRCVNSPQFSKSSPHAGVNLDRMITTPDPEVLAKLFGTEMAAKMTGPGVLECKTANEFVFAKIEKNGAPKDYVLQMQHSLAVKNWHWGIFAVLGYGPALWRLMLFPMFRDEALVETILNRVEEVWGVIENGPYPDALPQPDKRCKSCQFRKTCLGSSFMAPAEDGGDYVEDESLGEIVGHFLAAKREADEFGKIKDTIAGQLKKLLGDRQHVLVSALNSRIRFVPTEQERIDTDALRAKYPAIAKECSKKVPVRALYVEEV